jgi:hypothetical protein
MRSGGDRMGGVGGGGGVEVGLGGKSDTKLQVVRRMGY